MDKLNSVEITFENLDWINIPAAYIAHLKLNGLSFHPFREASLRDLEVDAVEFVLFAEAETDSDTFPGDWRHHGVWDALLLRLSQQDIAYLRLYYGQNGYRDFSVCWDDDPDNEYKNQNQRVSVDADNRYLVSISKAPHTVMNQVSGNP